MSNQTYLRFLPQKLSNEPISNVLGIDSKVYVCFMDELKFGHVLSPSNTNPMLVTNLAMRESDPATQTVAGSFVEWEVAQKKGAFKTNAKYEDNLFMCEPTLELVRPRCDETTILQMDLVRGSKLGLIFQDNNGKQRIGVNVFLETDSTISDSENNVKLKFVFPRMGQEPYFYEGPIYLRKNPTWFVP